MSRQNPYIFLSPSHLLSFAEHNPETRKVYGMEVLAVGTYRGITFAEGDLQEIADNFHKLKEKGLDVPLKVDHTDEASAIVGWITNVERRDDKLYADAEITEPIAYEKIVRGTWKKVSCEIYLNFVDDEGHSHGKVLRAIAIVAHPQIKRIRGLEVARFFEKITNGKEVMKMALRDAIASAFGWLSERFKKLQEEAEDTLELSPVRHRVEYDLVEDMNWDAEEAEKRLRQWASSDGSGSKEAIDWAKYREGFAWYDPDDGENFSAYKLPHHDIVDGRFVCVWRGVTSAMAALKGARGGVDIPQEDKQAVYDHLARHYEEFGRSAPELSEMEEGDETMLKLEEELKRLREENTQLRAQLEEMEKEKAKRLEEEKLERVHHIINDAIEKGKLLPAEKDTWAEYLLSLSEEDLEKTLKLIAVRPSLDLFEEKANRVSPQEEETRMNEEIARRLAGYIIRTTTFEEKKRR